MPLGQLNFPYDTMGWARYIVPRIFKQIDTYNISKGSHMPILSDGRYLAINNDSLFELLLALFVQLLVKTGY